MARQQVAYQGGQGVPQTSQMVPLEPVKAHFDPNDTGAFELARQLGALNTQGLTEAMDSLAVQKGRTDAEDQRQKAQAYADSLTVDELGKQVKDGTLLPSQSPVFAAALQHIYGENIQKDFENQTLGKLQSGELQFKSPQEVDKYVTDNRNQFLQGQSEYTTAGYDKGFGGFRDRLQTANIQVMDKEQVQRGIQEANDSLGNVIKDVTSPFFKGTKEEAAQAITDRYALLRKTSILRDDAAKESLQGALASISATGDKDLMASVLNSKLDNGITVAGVMGGVKAQAFAHQTEAQYDQTQRQQVDVELRPWVDAASKGELKQADFEKWVAGREKYVTTATYHSVIQHNQSVLDQLERKNERAQMLGASAASVAGAQQQAATLLAQGNFWQMGDTQVLTPEGGTKKFDKEAFAQQELSRQVQANNLPFDKQVQLYSTNGVENPVWKQTVQAGISNLASVGWSPDGKKLGEVNEQGKQTLDIFRQINAVNPQYAERLAGKDYKTLSDIDFLMTKGGFPDVNAAAGIINQVSRSGISEKDYGTMKADVKSAVDAVVNPHWYSSTTAWVGGMFGNDQVNLTQVASDVRRRAELLVASGQVPDAKAAVRASTEYFSNPAVATKINNTLYQNKDLPQVPQGEEVGKWMERFITEVPARVAASKGVAKDDIRLEANQYGGYTAWTAGVPLTDANGQVVTYKKDDVSKWVTTTMEADRHNAAATANYENYRARVDKELKAMQGKNVYALEQFDSTGDHSFWNNEIYSKDAYSRLLQSGEANKPLAELMKTAKANRTKGF